MSGVTVEADGQRCQGESGGLNERSVQAVTHNVPIYEKTIHMITSFGLLRKRVCIHSPAASNNTNTSSTGLYKQPREMGEVLLFWSRYSLLMYDLKKPKSD